MHKTLLEELITSLEEINHAQEYGMLGKYDGLNEFIDLLANKLDKNLGPNFVASCIVNVLCKFPAIMHDENKGRLYQLAKTIPCTELYLSEYTRQLFFGINNPFVYHETPVRPTPKK